jgi:hypothetical protein
MRYGVFFMGVLLSILLITPVEAFQFSSFRPLERLRYRAGACEEDLERLTYALLKERTYGGCLETALTALQNKRSFLSRQFERTYNMKNRQIQANYDPDLKPILIGEIYKRLEMEEAPASLFDQPLHSTPDSREEFVRFLTKFCRHSKAMTLPYSQERINRIEAGLERLDLHSLFEGFRRTLRVAEALRHQDPQILKGMKRLRGRFLLVMNQMVILKKALAGKKLPEGVEADDVMRRVILRTEWIDAYHQLKVHAMMSDACQQDKRVCDKTFEEMDWLVSVIQSFDDLKNVCWGQRRSHHSRIG